MITYMMQTEGLDDDEPFGLGVGEPADEETFTDEEPDDDGEPDEDWPEDDELPNGDSGQDDDD